MVIMNVRKLNQIHVFLTTTLDLELLLAGEVDISIVGVIMLPKKQRFTKTCTFKYQRKHGDLRKFLDKCKETTMHDLKNELLVSAFGHEVRQAHLQVDQALNRREWAQRIIEG